MQSPQVYSGHFSPEVEMRDISQYTQSTAQVAHVQAQVHYQPATSMGLPAATHLPQQHVNPFPDPQQAHIPQLQQQQALPRPQVPVHVPQSVYHPQPQRAPHPQRHPLQPGPSNTQRDREQASITQKQMQYLQLLERQHQRPLAQWQPSPASSLPVQVNNAQQPSTSGMTGATQFQQTVPQVAVTQPTIIEIPAQPTPPAISRSSPPQEELNNTIATETTTAPSTPTHNPSPPKIRSRRPFSLHDLRSNRKPSSRRSNSSTQSQVGDIREANSPTKVMGAETAGPSQSELATMYAPRSQLKLALVTVIPNGAKLPTPQQNAAQSSTEPVPSNAAPTSDSVVAPSAPIDLHVLPHAQIGTIMSSQKSSNMPSPPVQPSPVEIVGPMPDVATVSDPAAGQETAAVPKESMQLPAPVPNASAPPLNNPAQPQPQPAMTPQTSVPAPAASSSTKRPTGNPGAPIKVALGRLHELGVDCLAIVMQAAELVGASTEDLRVSGGAQPTHIPLFAPGQPLSIWLQKVQVTRAQGDAMVKHIWDLARKKASELGVAMDSLKNQTPANAANSASGQDANSPSIYGNSSTPGNSVVQAAPHPDPVIVQPVQAQPASSLGLSGIQPLETRSVQAPQQPHSASINSISVQVPSAPHQTTPAPAHVDTTSSPALPAAARMEPLVAIHPQVPQQHPAPIQFQPQPSYNNPAMQGLHQFRHYRPNGAPPPQSQPHSQVQIHGQAHVPPNLASQVPTTSVAPVSAVQPPKPAFRPLKPKPKNTAALDYLRSLGITPDDDSPPAPTKPLAAEAPKVVTDKPERAKDKGKGKATDVNQPVERPIETQIVPVQSGPSQEQVAPEKDTEPMVVNETRPTEPTQVSQPPVESSAPSPMVPDIAVLPEPPQSSPSPASPATGAATPVIQIPTVVAAPTPVRAPLLVAASAPILETPMPEQTSTSPPAPAPSDAISVSPTPPPEISVAQAITPTERVVSAVSTPVASTSALPQMGQPSTEPPPLKRKRKPIDPLLSANIPLPNLPPKESWAQAYATAMNDLYKPHGVKRPRTTDPIHDQASSSKSSSNKARPLFRPETPSSDEDIVPARPAKKDKRRMIMEVVLPLRKAKGKAVAGV